MDTLYDHWQRATPGTFQDGVQLLLQHCPGAATPILLGRFIRAAGRGGYVSEYDSAKLAGILRAHPAPDAGHTPARIPLVRRRIKQPEGQRQDPAPDADQPDNDKPVKPSARAIALHKEHSHHHALLVAATTDAQRAEHAAAIMQRIIPALDAEYDRTRIGATTDEPPRRGVAGSADLLRRLQVVRVRLSKLKKLIPAAPNLERRRQLETEQAEKEAEKARLELELA